jgi:DNA replication initiation complex subunit (GINS family)
MTKKERILYHKLAALSNLLIMELDEMKPTAAIGANMHQKAKEFIEALEPFIEASFDSEQIRSGTYLTDLCHKLDTVIRKNYEQITS